MGIPHLELGSVDFASDIDHVFGTACNENSVALEHADIVVGILLFDGESKIDGKLFSVAGNGRMRKIPAVKRLSVDISCGTSSGTTSRWNFKIYD